MIISPVFRTAYIKTLSAVEVNPEMSNQHEFNGVQGLKHMFGENKFMQDAIFSIQGEELQCRTGITWYDAREAHQTRTEYRLYFKSNHVMHQANEGDNIVIGFCNNNEIHCILIKKIANSNITNEPTWRSM